MFTSKKGSTHVDWILSTGLFLVSLIAAFIFIKPGVVPTANGNFATDVLINKFNENFLWTIKTVPYFIEECKGVAVSNFGLNNFDGGSGSSSQPVGNLIKKFLLENNYLILTGLQTSSLGNKQCSDDIDNDDDGAVDFPADFSCDSKIDNDELLPKSQCQNGIDDDDDSAKDYPDDIGCNNLQDNDEIGIPVLTDSKVEFSLKNDWLISKIRYSDTGNDWASYFKGDSNIMINCRNSESNNNENRIFNIEKVMNAKFLLTYYNPEESPLSPNIEVKCASRCIFQGRFGSEDETQGINLELLNLFKLGGDGAAKWQDTRQVKKDWGFPEANEFWIQGWRESDKKCGHIDTINCNYIVNYKTANPSQEDDVKVREVKTFIARKDTTLEGVRLFFRVW